MTEKRRPTHDLAAIKAAFATPATLNRTKVSARDATALGMDAAAVVAVIQGLQQPGDFDKSATAHHHPRQWHDSYKPLVGGVRLSVKFTVDDEGKFVPSDELQGGLDERGDDKTVPIVRRRHAARHPGGDRDL